MLEVSTPLYTSDPSQPYAALDLGSNSFHLLIAKDSPHRMQVIDKHRESVRLAAGLAKSGKLSNQSIAQALSCLERIGERLRNLPSHNVRIVGTNALRQAKNRDVFVERAEKVLGHTIEIISGREEARLIYLGVSHSLEDRHDARLVVDIGGGSTEFILGRQFQPRLTESLFMGCISMTDNWFVDGQISEKNMRNAENDALHEIEVIERAFHNHGWDVAIGTSGTVLAVFNAIEPSDKKGISRVQLHTLRKQLIDYKHVDRLPTDLVNRNRAPIFAGGTAILCAIFNAFDLDFMEVSSGALREGVLHDLLGRVHDQDIRVRSVADLVRRFHIDEKHADQVAATALQIFDSVASSWKLHSEDDRNLLRWGATLHEIGMDISHTSYHKHGAYLLENLDIPGFSMHEQHVLAVLVRTHRRKFPLDEIGDNKPLLKLCLILRLAVLLRRNRALEPLPKIRLKIDIDSCQLALPRAWLERHPLTQLDLAQEVEILQDSPITLTVS